MSRSRPDRSQADVISSLSLDPMRRRQPRQALPTAALDASPLDHPGDRASRGHVGFLEGAPWAPRLWGEEEGARFLAEALAAR
jgi:hypothetical protein